MLFEAHPEIDIHEMSPLALAFAGWLHLMGRDDRIEELFETIWKNYTPEQ